MPGKPHKRHPVTQPLDKSYRFIALTQNQNAVVDTLDFDWLNQWVWTAEWSPCTNSFYAYRKIKGKTVKMHRIILECGANEECDHIDGDTLNNRRYNLRRCTHAQNQRNQGRRSDNSSGYKGVSWHAGLGKWRARIKVDGIEIRLGAFLSAEMAARAYDEAAKQLHGEFAHLNFSN